MLLRNKTENIEKKSVTDDQWSVANTPSCLLASFILLVLSLALAPAAFPSEKKALQVEYSVKASFIYNFTKFIQWPKASFPRGQNAFVIGIVGDDPFGQSMDHLAEKKRIKGRKVVIKRFASSKKIEGCQILFISSSKKKKLGEIIKELQNRPVLLVGDSPRFAERGTAINFTILEKKVRFEINRKALKDAGLTASAQLLNLAIIVKGK